MIPTLYLVGKWVIEVWLEALIQWRLEGPRRHGRNIDIFLQQYGQPELLETRGKFVASIDAAYHVLKVALRSILLLRGLSHTTMPLLSIAGLLDPKLISLII